MIEGVQVRRLTPHVDDRGSLTEVLRSDWPEFIRFGQATVTVNLPGVIRGWHWHRRQTDLIVVVRGRALVPLYDARPGSGTSGVLEEHIASGADPLAIVVPPGVYHGYKTLGDEPAVILNFPDRLYDASRPDEERVPHDAAHIAYGWDGGR